MKEAIIVWHVGGRLQNGLYVGGDVYTQKVDTDRLGYWCLLDYARGDLGQNGNFRLFFNSNLSGGLQVVHDDATTCLLLTCLNEIKKVDIYIVKDKDNGEVGQTSYTFSREGCGSAKVVGGVNYECEEWLVDINICGEGGVPLGEEEVGIGVGINDIFEEEEVEEHY